MRLLAVALALAGAVDAARAGDASRLINVDLDWAKIVTLLKGPIQIILGNPIIVGLTRLPDSGRAVLTGKAFGETNMVVLDGKGAIVTESSIRVAPPAAADLVVQRKQQHSTYACASGCELRSQLGNAGKDAGAQIGIRDGLARPDSTTPGVNGGGALQA